MDKPKRNYESIEINPEFRRALDIMEGSNKNIFVTGRAGTGKSTLLEYFRDTTKKEIAVLAPTGVGAVNVKGQTIHSFFGFKPNITLAKIKPKKMRKGPSGVYKKLGSIVIDEISMVRADLLDCVDKFLRLYGRDAEKPFGGIQMIFIGDLYQLPPVVTGEERAIFKTQYRSPYFFDARVFSGLEMEFVELEKIYRQKDDRFISILNAVRNNSITEKEIDVLNSRYDPDFEPLKKDFYVHMTTTNAMAEEVNERRLSMISGDSQSFLGMVEGKYGQEYMPTSYDLKLKRGAQVMLLNNDSSHRWVNGTIGEVVDFEIDEAAGGAAVVRLPDGEVVIVEPFTWEIFKFSLKDNQLSSDVVGAFTQLPLKLAWAVTIHKSQGKTFDRVVIDMGRGAFAHGQTYVALSRCTTLGGIVLKKPLRKEHVLMDWRVVDFLTRFQYRKSEEDCPFPEKISIIEDAIRDKAVLKIIYLKSNDVKSSRLIRPDRVGEMEYNGKKYVGVEAFCQKRNEKRVFRVDRILEISRP